LETPNRAKSKTVETPLGVDVQRIPHLAEFLRHGFDRRPPRRASVLVEPIERTAVSRQIHPLARRQFILFVQPLLQRGLRIVPAAEVVEPAANRFRPLAVLMRERREFRGRFCWLVRAGGFDRLRHCITIPINEEGRIEHPAVAAARVSLFNAISQSGLTTGVDSHRRKETKDA
jgi:hypothetical protein